jgi:hypothetical protein
MLHDLLFLSTMLQVVIAPDDVLACSPGLR